MEFLIVVGAMTVYLGFTTLTGAISISSTLVNKFINSDYLKISLSYLNGQTQDISNKQTSATFIIENTIDYRDDAFGRKLFVQNIDQDTGGKNNIYHTAVRLHTFAVTLTDRDDVVINLNGVDWWCMVEFEYVDEIVHTVPHSSHLPWMRF